MSQNSQSYGIRSPIKMLILHLQSGSAQQIIIYTSIWLKIQQLQKNNDKTELLRLYYSALDTLLEEINHRFGERNTQLAQSLIALNPESDQFLDPKFLKHIISLTKSTIHEMECIFAKQFISTHTQKKRKM